MIRKNIFKEKKTEEDFLKKHTLFENNQLSVESYYFLPGQEFPLHRHPRGTQVIMIFRGEGEFYVKKGDSKEIESFIVKDGDILFLEPDQWHGAKNCGDSVLIVGQVTLNNSGIESFYNK